MSANRSTLENQLQNYEQRLSGLKAFVRELNDRVTHHGTDKSLVEEDLIEAENNIAYYTGEVARLRGELGGARGGGGGSSVAGVLGGALPQTVNQGVGTLVLSVLCFTAGVLVGSRLLSNRGDD